MQVSTSLLDHLLPSPYGTLARLTLMKLYPLAEVARAGLDAMLNEPSVVLIPEHHCKVEVDPLQQEAVPLLNAHDKVDEACKVQCAKD